MNNEQQLDLTGRLLNALEAISTHLGQLYQRDFRGVGEALNYARTHHHTVVNANWLDLDALVDLRNVIQHGSVLGGQPIATPRPDATARAEELARLIVTPPLARDFAHRPEVLPAEATIADAAKLLARTGYSQFPVYRGKQFLGLITGNMLAAWLASADGSALQPHALSVEELLPLARKKDRAHWISPGTPAASACRILQEPNAPAAVLISSTGKPNGTLSGIIARADIAAIRSTWELTPTVSHQVPPRG